MKGIEADQEDELRPHYDLESLEVRRLGGGRRRFGKTRDLKEIKTESILQTIEDDTDPMSHNFAQVVEEVKQLSPAEMEELQDLLKQYLIQKRRQEILENCEASLKELREGKLTFSSDIESLMEQLSHD